MKKVELENFEMIKKAKEMKGITLIALVVTIIILIILAAVSVNLLFGQYSLINRAREGEEKYQEQQAREKLELELADLYAEKAINEDYNQEEYLTERLEEKGFIVNDDIVNVDGWKFEINRSIPKIEMALGKVEEILGDIQISNAQELVEFRDAVNSGTTYEGKTIILKGNIDLSSICGKNIGNWIPIGIGENTFKGIFNGNNHTISNLYINSDQYVASGLFGKIDTSAIIENIDLQTCDILNKYTSSENRTGSICGYNSGTIRNCHATGIVQAINNVNITTEVGGICGFNLGIIDSCYNNVTVYSQNSNSASAVVYAGGIVGYNWKTVKNSYNLGTIEAVGKYSRSGGICGFSGNTEGKIENSYNIGTIQGTETSNKYISGICGVNGNSSYKKGVIDNSYCINNITYSSHYYSSGFKTSTEGIVEEDILKNYAETLGDQFTNDIKKENGTWKYNDGYPILKWQIENNR